MKIEMVHFTHQKFFFHFKLHLKVYYSFHERTIEKIEKKNILEDISINSFQNYSFL
jgi:hypothetical protein